MLFALIAIIVSVIILFIASIEDLKTREVPDYLSYFLIGSAIFIRILWFLFERDISILYWMPVALGALGGFSYLMYIAGQWGGGDVKILIGISLLLSSFPSEVLPFFLNFLFNSLIVGAFYGVASILYVCLKNIKKIKFNTYEKALLPTTLLISILMFYFAPLAIAFLGIFLMISLVSLVYFKKVEKKIMESFVSVDKLTEGDWLVKDVKLNGKVFVKKRNIGLTIQDINKLKRVKNKIKKVKIKTGIPFVPVFLISVIVTFLFGNLLFSILLLS